MLQIQPLINQFGITKTRLYLQDRFSRLENFWEFVITLYCAKMPDLTPEFHRLMIKEAIKIRDDGTIYFGFNALGAPRGGAKSTVFGTFLLSWIALNGFLRHALYCSDTHRKAISLSSPLRKQIENNKVLNFIYPEARDQVNWGKESYTVKGLRNDCIITPLGSGMNVRGQSEDNVRPEIVFCDDLENSESVYSSDQRKKLYDWFWFDLVQALDRYHKNIIYIGTILHYNSLLKQALNQEDRFQGWHARTFKAINGAGQSFWPARYPIEYLKAIRDDPNHPEYIGSVVFSQEMQNEPQDDKDRIIKLDWIKEYSYNEKWRNMPGKTDQEKKDNLKKNLEIVAGVDPAISEKDQADNFSMYVYGFEESTACEYMLDLVWIKEPDIDNQVKLLCDAIQNWKIEKIGIESNAFQSGLATLVKKELNRRGIYFCAVKAIHTDKDKIRRARIHSSAFQAGFIRFRDDHPHLGTLRTEILGFPLEKHDDTFDSLMLARETRQHKKARAFKKKPKGF